VLQHPQRLGDPVALTVNFCAALADGPFTVNARPARTNRSTQHWVIEIQQGEEVVLTATAFTAVRRDTFAAEEHTLPVVPPPADVPLPPARGRVEWINRYEMRFVEGGFPAQWDGTDHGASRTRCGCATTRRGRWTTHRWRRWPTCSFPACGAAAPRWCQIGTVSMTVYFHADAAQLAATGTGYLLGQAQAPGVSQTGYFDQTAQLWNEAGDLLATTHQVVYYKE
jgi:hypothetical protein